MAKKKSGRLRALLLAVLPLAAWAQEQRFDIGRFEVEGNTLLAPAEVRQLVAPFEGPGRNYADIQRALEALERAYRRAGYGTVQVYVPEQELTGGVVRLQVTEAVIGQVEVTGNRHFSAANVRAALPALREGQAPNLRLLSENVQLSNENPAKQVEVTLGVADEEDKVNAKVAVTDQNPQRLYLTLDNTGTGATGKHRLGVAYQNANVLDRDQTLTVAYTTAPDRPENVKVDIVSVAYKLPFHAIGDSVDVIYGNSNVNTPAVQATGFSISGKGSVFGLRWNHYFPRQGTFSSKLIAGFDYKHIDTRCTNPATGAEFGIDPPVPGNPSCTPHTLRPLSLAYTGQWQQPGAQMDFNAGIARNWPLGTRYDWANAAGAGGSDRYSAINLSRPTADAFTVLRFGGSYTRAFQNEWQVRLVAAGQYAGRPLPAAEQIGLAGATAVRGFNERAVATDQGWFLNMELYTPDLGPRLQVPGNLRALVFYDMGRGYNLETVRLAPTAAPYAKAGIGALGAGLRYALDKDFSLQADLVRVVDAGPYDVPGAPGNTESRGDWRGHFGMLLAF